MGFKINLLFMFVMFSMFSIGYPCSMFYSSSLPPLPPFKPPDYCSLDHDPALCPLNGAMFNTRHIRFQWRFYFSNVWKDCFLFKYWNCIGNKNNFGTYGECIETCNNTKPLLQPSYTVFK